METLNHELEQLPPDDDAVDDIYCVIEEYGISHTISALRQAASQFPTKDGEAIHAALTELLLRL